MRKGMRFGFTAAEKTEMWERWRRGESLKAIGRVFGKEGSSVYCSWLIPGVSVLDGDDGRRLH
jgi:hypothetical protein